ncbi:MAG: L,D-transpeptidase family protein [Novosphingobium sp.]
MRVLQLLLPLVLLGGCNFTSGDKDDPTSQSSASTAAQPLRDVLASHDREPQDQQIPDSEVRPMMQAQVVLDRLGFTPGVVDGKNGLSTRNAVAGFQEANALTVTGELDVLTLKALARWNDIPATRVVTIPAEFAAGPFYAIPADPAKQAEMPTLTYESLDEKLAERFHTTIATLQALNPGGVPAGMTPPAGAALPMPQPVPSETPADALASDATGLTPGPASVFHAGQQIRVPNVGGDAINPGSVTDQAWLQTLAMLGVGSEQPKAADIVVSKSKGTLKAFDADGKLIAVYTATMGSSHDPLPLGNWKIQGIAHNPKFHYDPALFWNAEPGSNKALLPAGPNGPVGVVWIDLSKPHYGIHGTPRPETIGRAESHGCVRLTNWDAARLAQMVSTSTKVQFES